MAIVVRYVDKGGIVTEHFLGIIQVVGTTAFSLKGAIDLLFSRHGLSLSRLRGQGYDGASNMQGEFDGLKTLIMRENEFVFYVHCFAYQLQLTLVAVAKNHIDIVSFMCMITSLVNVIGGSCKRRDILRDTQVAKVSEGLNAGELSGGRGLNQETSLKWDSDTRWGSHYGTILNLIVMFSSIIYVLEFVQEDGTLSEQRAEASFLMGSVQSFDFIFGLYLMKNILGITNKFLLALQRKYQDIVNAMKLVKMSKLQLQKMRDDEWESLLTKVFSFYNKHGVSIPNLNDIFVVPGRPRHKAPQIKNLHHYHVELFYTFINMLLQELNICFTKLNTELLLCVACLNPTNSFFAFDKERLVCLAQFYASYFFAIDLVVLDHQLQNHIADMRSSSEFLELKGIGDIARKLVETKKHIVYPLVYLLLKLTLILLIATAIVEIAFSAMKYVKNILRNRMGDQWMNDCLVTYIENDVFASVDNEAIMQ